MGVRVTSKGQVTIPKLMRDRRGIKPGSVVNFEFSADGSAILRRADKRSAKPSRFHRLRGTATGRLTTDQIMALTRGED
jgi:AbrB family looped-hinge helix DNA binding protein